MAEHCSDLPVTACCRVMRVSTSGFYQRKAQPVTDRDVDPPDQRLGDAEHVRIRHNHSLSRLHSAHPQSAG